MSAGSAYSAPIFNEKHSSSSRQALADSASVPIYMWATNEPEEDDFLHAASPVATTPGNSGFRRGNSNKITQPFIFCSMRGWANVGMLLLLVGAILALFLGYPVIAHFTGSHVNTAGFNLGGINGSGQIPDLPGLRTLIDKDTPQDALSRVGSDGETYNLVFSDEFETDGRSFYPGDDPYWEAQDLHYWETGASFFFGSCPSVHLLIRMTGDFEWYDPSAVTTENGRLVFTLSKKANHDLDYMSGMITSWNKVSAVSASRPP